MSMPADILLDVTTHYSILGLSSDATANDIHKSYMKLARQLHPDKSKSDTTGEQFKLVSHAHYVLMDKEQRLKYDDLLHSKGLLGYKPKGKYHKYVKSTQKNEKSSTKAATTQRAANRHQPYEQQPYGFGTESSKNSHPQPKVPIFQSFNLKTYQRKQRSTEEKASGKPKPSPIVNFFTEPYHEPQQDLKQRAMYPPSTMDIDDRASMRRHDKGHESIYEEEHEREDNKGGEQLRSKMHKANTSYTSDNTPSSPFNDNQHRHYARKKHEAKVHGRRSTSPIKSATTSENAGISESWNGLKDILDNFPSHNDERVNRRDTKLRDFPGFAENTSSKIRKAHTESMRLDDLDKSLPQNDDLFDMHKVSDILEDVPTFKRAKKDSAKDQHPDIEMISPLKNELSRFQMNNPANLSHGEPLHMPVNQPLPKVYKPDTIALDQYKINSQVTQWALPVMPIFQCNVLDGMEVEHCKRSVIEFNAKCNTLKENLIAVMHNRLKADQELDGRLVRIENAANWVSCKDFDFEVVNKLSELQNRQRIVAQSFASLLNSIYSTAHQ